MKKLFALIILIAIIYFVNPFFKGLITGFTASICLFYIIGKRQVNTAAGRIDKRIREIIAEE